MVGTKPRRGRPIGTGIDDSDRIERLAELLRTQPHLKPTTAIRAMGFSDPSTIRRLRDKYKAFRKAAQSATASTETLAGGLQGPNLAGPRLQVRKPDAAVIAATAASHAVR